MKPRAVFLQKKNPCYVSCNRLMKYKHESNKNNKIVLNTEHTGNTQNTQAIHNTKASSYVKLHS